MRLAILALSAAAISGCSWLSGGQQHSANYAIDCYPGGGQGYHHGYGYAQGAACPGGTYNVAPGYGTDAYGYQYGAQGYAPQAYGSVGQGMSAYGAGYSASGVTTLGASAPYGAAYGSQYGASGQFGQVPAVQTVAGSPLYVGQPYPVPQAGGPGCCGDYGGGFGGGTMPFGVEVFAGTEFSAGGDVFTRKPVGPPDGDFTMNTRVGGINPIGYDQAFGDTQTVGVALSYDLSPTTTILGSVANGNADGRTISAYTTVQPGTWSGTTFTPTAGSTPRTIDGAFSDLETTTLEAGLRHYVGHPRGLRPYIGASAGFIHNNDVTLTQTYTDDGTVYGEREFIREGWNPTASGTIGAELALGPRTAIGVETGIRWKDSMSSKDESEDRITVPVSLRGRLSF